jgi:hypothetical protein
MGVSPVTARLSIGPYSPNAMSGPRDLTAAELERNGLGLIQRRAGGGEHVIRVYCLRCGSQVASERMDADPDGWWACVRGCNTRFLAAMTDQATRPNP